MYILRDEKEDEMAVLNKEGAETLLKTFNVKAELPHKDESLDFWLGDGSYVGGRLVTAMTLILAA